MPRKAAKITQADVARTIRAAKQSGATSVQVRPDGTVVVMLRDASDAPKADGETSEDVKNLL